MVVGVQEVLAAPSFLLIGLNYSYCSGGWWPVACISLCRSWTGSVRGLERKRLGRAWGRCSPAIPSRCSLWSLLTFLKP